MKLNQRVRLKNPELFSAQEVDEIKQAKARQEKRIVRLPEEKDQAMATKVSEMTKQIKKTAEPKAPKINKRVRDQYNNIITAGDFINYPGRHQSDTYMRTARVLEVTTRDLDGDKPEPVIKVAVAMKPRYHQRMENPRAKTVIRKTTISEFHRATIIPKAYVQNDPYYRCLMEV